jgi:hypothetical protein
MMRLLMISKSYLMSLSHGLFISQHVDLCMKSYIMRSSHGVLLSHKQYVGLTCV